MRWLFIFLLFFNTTLFADTYRDISITLDTSAVETGLGSVKKNAHDRYTITLDEDGIFNTSLGGANLDSVRFAISTTTMPTTDGTLTSYGPQTFSAGQVIYIKVNAPGETADKSYDITFSLTPLNSAPTDIALSPTSVNENMPLGTLVGNLSTTDVDVGDAHTYTLVAGSGDADNGSFNISGTTLVTNEIFDFETKNSYSVRIETDDGNGGTFQKSFTITILDAVEGIAPVITAGQEFNVSENAAVGAAVGTVAVANSPTSFSIVSGNTDNIFAIDNLGNITVADNTNLDYETTTSYTLEINASNVTGSDSKDVIINIDNAVDLAGVNKPDFHQCGVFPSALTSYATINSNSQSQSVQNTDTIYAASTTNPNPTTMPCTLDSVTDTCNVGTPPANTLSLPSYSSSSTSSVTLTSNTVITALNADAYTINTNNLTITFDPGTQYNDDATKVMFIKALNVNGSDITYIFNEGDYFIDQWNFGTNTNIQVTGPVRLFFNSNMQVNNGYLNLNAGGSVENLFVFVDGSVNLPATFDIDGYIYTTSNLTANNHSGSQTLNGAITAEGDINLGASQVYTYNDSGLDSNGYGLCSAAPVDSNTYGCDMFGSVIVTYDFLDVSGTANARACGTENISYPSGQISGSIDCLSDIACGGTGAACEQSDPPANKLTYTWTHPDSPAILDESPINPAVLNDISYGNIAYGSGSVNFNATAVNTFNGNKYMYIGDATFDQTLITFTAGDYYFESFSITKNKNDVNNFVIDSTNGPVRIFIKNDLSFDLNNLYLNHSGTPSDLFIYVGGNYTNPGSGGGNTHMNAYFYVEGDVLLNNSSNNWIIEGGITAEGQITIAGNNPDFIETDEANNLGYGACSICFQDVQGTTTSPYDVTNSFVNLKGSTIYSLNVFKTYSGVNSRSGCNTTDGSCTQSSNIVDFDNLENFTYGNTYDGYNYNLGDYAVFQFSTIEDSNTHVFDLDEYDTAIRVNNNVDVKALFVADYYDAATNGKYYHTIVEKCTLGTAGKNFSPGVLDAVDTNCSTLAGCAGNNISTKIAGKAYDLNILDSNASSNMLFGAALVYDVDGEANYKYIGEINATDESGITTFTLENSDSPNDWANISDIYATQEAWIQFYYCNTTPSWRDCYVVGGENVYITKSEDANESSSHDKFSIRPKSYNIALNVDDVMRLKAGETYQIDTNSTYDANLTNTTGYTQTLGAFADKNASNVLNPSSSACTITGSSSFNADFSNGAFSSGGYTFDNVGDINITMIDSSWTIVDQSNGGCMLDSNSTTSTPYGCNIKSIKQVRFTPDHFNIAGSLNNSGNAFTYYSSDLNHSATLDMNISAVTQSNVITTYYTQNCYARDINISLDSSDAGLIYSLDTTPTTIIEINEGNFSDGNASVSLNVNFGRDKNVTKNPIQPTIDAVVKESEDGDINGTQSFSSGATFVYGRAHVPRQRVSGDETTLAVIPIYYEAYCDSGCNSALLPASPQVGKDSINWYNITPSHVSSDGNVSAASNSEPLENAYKSVTPSQILFKYDGTRGYPFKTSVDIIPSSWLVYNRYDGNALFNSFELEFQNKGVLAADENLTNVDSNIEVKTNRRLIW